MGISTDNSGMGLSAFHRGVYQVHTDGSGSGGSGTTDAALAAHISASDPHPQSQYITAAKLADYGITALISTVEVIGDAAVPGQPVSLLVSAQSRLVGGSIARFDVTYNGVLSQWPASNNSAVITLTFQGAVGDTRSLVLTAVDDLGNHSALTTHIVTLADNITPPAPNVTSPTAGATGVSLTPQLSASAFVVAGASHASTDWQIRAADGQTVVWQSLNNTSQLTSIAVPANTLSTNTGYQAWVRYRTSTGAVTAWGSAGFTTLAVPAALAGEMSWTTPGSYTWTVPDGVTSASALVVDGSGGDAWFGALTITGGGQPQTSTIGTAINADVTSIAHGNGVTIATGTSNIIWRSTDNGASFNEMLLPVTTPLASHVATDGHGMWVICWRDSVDLLVSTNNGATWQLLTDQLPQGFPKYVIATNGNGTWAICGEGIYLLVSYDNAVTWQVKRAPAGMVPNIEDRYQFYNVFVVSGGACLFSEANGKCAVLATSSGTPYAATMFSAYPGRAAIAADEQNILLAVGSSVGYVVKSQDDGNTWTQVGTLPDGMSGATRISYGNGVWMASAGSGVGAYSTNGGATWVRVPGSVGGLLTYCAAGVFISMQIYSAIARHVFAATTPSHADATLTSSSGFSLTAPTSSGSYGISSGVAAYDNNMPLTPGAQITVNVPGPDGAVRVIWGTGRSFPNNAASAGTQIGIVLVAEGGGAGQWQRVDGNFNPVNYPFGGAFFNSHPTYAGIVDQTIDGQAMVKVPKFWFKTGNVPSGQYAGKRFWMISDQPAPGFAVHPAFMNYGAEVAQYWLGKYQGTADGGKLGSQTGLMPLTNLDFPTMQARAVARNVSGVSGFMMWSIYQLAAVQMLCLIEMGSSDSQTVIGAGNIDNPSAGPTVVDSQEVSTASWRGVVGLWGNVWQRLHGLMVDGASIYNMWDHQGHRAFVHTRISAPLGGYALHMSDASGTDFNLAAVFAPESTSAISADGTYGRDAFAATPNGFAMHGGAWGGRTDAGLFDMSASLTTFASTFIGTRLAKY